MKATIFIILNILTTSAFAQVDTTKTGFLKKKPVELKEVVVKSHRIISMADKFVMSVPMNDNKNGEELLRQAPSVVLNGKNITINGEGGTKVFVNDREIRLDGENLIAYVRSLSSKDIDRIEVQSMANASDDANAKGGVIRIKLRHKTEDDYQGNLTLKNMASAQTNGIRPSASFSMHKGKWDFYAFGSGTWTMKNKGTIGSTRQYKKDTDGFTSNGNISVPAKNMNIYAGAFYAIDSVRSIGAEVGYFNNYTDMQTISNSTLNLGNNIYKSNADYSQKMDFYMYSASINYQRKFDENGSAFKILADYARKESTNKDLYDIRWLWDNNDTTYRSHLTSNYDIASADMSFKKVYSHNTSLHTGVKFTTTQMKNNNDYQGLQNNVWSELANYRYSSQYNEYIWAAYVELNTEIRNWQIAAGLRGEKTKTENNTSDINKNYFNLYPHLTLGYSFDEMKRWMISLRYARQIERPAFDALNPNRIQISQYSYQIGNPNLRPTYINKISATLIRDYRYTLTIGCNLHTDLIREFAKQDQENKDVSYVTYENHHHENHWFVNLNVPFQIGKIINLITNVIAVRQCIQTAEGDNYANHNLLFINCTANVTLPQHYAIELEYNMHNRLFSGNSSVASNNLLNFKVKKTFANDKLLLTAGIDNILNEPNRYKSLLSDYQLISKSKMGSEGRVANMTLTYNFNAGKKLKERRVENSSSEERGRISKSQQ